MTFLMGAARTAPISHLSAGNRTAGPVDDIIKVPVSEFSQSLNIRLLDRLQGDATHVCHT